MTDSADTSVARGATPRPHPGSPNGTPQYSVDAADLIEPIQRAELPHDPRDAREELDSQLPALDLPGFGGLSSLDCGRRIPQSRHFCPDCADIKPFRHVCYEYDCEEHAPHAVRRRAAGSNDAAGVAPQLNALRKYLYTWRDEQDHYYHHLVFSPPDDYFLEADDPLKRGVEIVREQLDALGAQGLVAYHPYRGADEDHDGDDRDFWKQLLFHGRDWDGDVADKLDWSPHFHAIVVAPYIDMSDSGGVEEETGWVLQRITKDDSNVSLENDRDMASALTYTLSHAGVYDTSEQRRLAAWMKGPDVHKVVPKERDKARMKALVHDAARDTLGIDPPDMTCDRELPEEIRLGNSDDGLADVDVDLHGQESPVADAFEPDLAGPSGPAIGGAKPGSRSGLHHSTDRHVDGVAGMASPSTSLDDQDTDDDLATSSSSGTSPSSTSSDDQETVDDAATTCGGRIQHISVAGEYLLDDDWRNRLRDQDVAELDDSYRGYVRAMRRKNLDPQDGEPDVVEHAGAGDDLDDDLDGPPPD